MRARVKAFHSPDVQDLTAYQPQEKDNFCFLLQVMIGPADMEGEESFDIEVCTPKWLLNTHGIEEVIIGRHRLIVFEYNFKRIKETIISYCEACKGDDWKEIAQKLSRLGKWEFEDYQP